MSLPLFALVRLPHEAEPVVRGVFTTPEKAKNHDPDLRTGWVRGPETGKFETNLGSLINYHQVVPIFANEEFSLT